jgi:Zn-dependent M28 family amino/carboxypeptidase
MWRGVAIILALLADNALAQLLPDIKQLSSPEMQGRETGTAGAEHARFYIGQRYQALALDAFNGSFLQPFSYAGWHEKQGINMVAYRRGCTYPDRYVVVTAHYDHLGKQGRTIFYGADDNASGVAALLELATRLSLSCPAYSYIFLATDAEENGLYGSKAFVAAPPIPLAQIVLNLNLDMLSRPGRRGKLYLTGARKFPALVAQLQTQFNKIHFLPHSGPPRQLRSNQRYDWPEASDHGPFYRAGIPYLFFGGQEHPHYHTADDTWQRVDTVFLDKAMQAVWQSVQWLEMQTPEQLSAKH